MNFYVHSVDNLKLPEGKEDDSALLAKFEVSYLKIFSKHNYKQMHLALLMLLKLQLVRYWLSIVTHTVTSLLLYSWVIFGEILLKYQVTINVK